jgi:HEPN domain-containing protein
MKRETKEWIRKAEMDWESALDLSAAAFRSHKVFHDTICFHCQQTAEKYLKALVQELGAVVPRTHDLELILERLSRGNYARRAFRRRRTRTALV